MMIERLRQLLASIPQISAWRIRDRRIEGRELYLIRRSVDMQRSKDVRHTYLTIYRDFQEEGNAYRGSVDVQIHPTYSDGEIRALIEQSLDSARYVCNQRYPLVEPGNEPRPLPVSSLASRPLEHWLGPLAETIYAQEDRAEARINSAELFLDRVDTRIVNSLGLDVSYQSYSGYLELIVEEDGKAEDDAKGEGGPPPGGVELYRELSFSEFQPEMLASEVREQLRYCGDRATAGSTPHLKRFPVLLTGDPVPGFFGYYLIQSAADSVYSGISTAKLGESIQGEGISGDRLTLNLEPFLKNSPVSAPVDADGFALASTRIVDAGRLERYWGSLRFCHYLNVPATGAIGNVVITPGLKSVETLREGPHLEVVYFSDFVTEPLTGDFGGEIRLAYYTDSNGKRRPVTGGSVSGNIRDVQARMYLSRESQVRAGFQGPLSVFLPEISVSGAAST
jgi:predicted Zn-dependent protease